MGVNNRGSIDPRYVTHQNISIDGFKNCTIQILDPNIDTIDSAYNAWTNAGMSAMTVLWTGPAQMNVFRQTLNAEVPGGAITQVRSLRFIAPKSGPNFPIRKGLQVRVIRCPEDPGAIRYQYTVTSGLGAGLGWGRTIEAESDMSVILPIPPAVV